MNIRIDTHLGAVEITLEPTAGVKQIPTGAKYVWRLDPDEAVKVASGLFKAARLLGEKDELEHGSRTKTQEWSTGAEWSTPKGAS